MHVSSLIIIVHKWTRNINACKLIGASGKIIDWVSLFARFFLLIKAVGFLLLLSHLNLFFLLLHCSHSTKDNIKPVWCVFFFAYAQWFFFTFPDVDWVKGAALLCCCFSSFFLCCINYYVLLIRKLVSRSWWFF